MRLKSIIWKIYFTLFVLIVILGIPGGKELNKLISNPWGVVSLLIVPLVILALYSYIFHKKIISPKIWKVIFWIQLISWIAIVFYNVTSSTQQTKIGQLFQKYPSNITFFGLIGFILALIFFEFIPLYVIYKLSQDKK